jgi:conjugative transfer signal peptidase TraF
MTRRPTTLITMVAAIALLVFASSKRVPLLVWNVSESVPIRLYHVQPTRMLFITTLVVAFPPEPLAAYLAQRGYLPRRVPLLKRILALPGQSVCRSELLITVDGIDVGRALERDRHDRTLPVWQGCRVIADGDVFLMNWDEPSSFDGRYFGPIPSSAIVGRAEPMLTFEGD